ncbi:MAG: hypothetical protein E6K96_09470 [Thaumarchaeota archaeon]|nr:MAG: hypothetical protein E6K96_09470 [Nitrososphaerota archaeon]
METRDYVRSCAYCDAEVLMPPPRDGNRLDELRPYVCSGCHRRLEEKETTLRPFNISRCNL